MNDSRPLSQVRSIDAYMLNHITKVQNNFTREGSSLSRLMNFASSVPDFRRSDKGNFRHQLKDIIMLMILGRMCGCVGRADIIEFGKHNIEKFRKMGMLKDRLGSSKPVISYIEGPELSHGRIETMTYRIYDGLDMIADKDKWGGSMTVIEYVCDTVKKSTNVPTSEKRLYVSSLPLHTPTLGALVRDHWSIESMHWGLDVNLSQDRIRRKSLRSARNLDTIQRIVHAVFSIWRAAQEAFGQKKRYGGTHEACVYVFYQAPAFS